DVLTADFGFDGPALGSIGDFVWLDTDGDGVQDAGELGIEGVTLDLLDASGDVVATMTTDEDGAYDFTGLLAGNYQVRVTDLGGVLDGLNLSGGTNPTGTIALAAGQDFDLADFGYTAAALNGSLGNLVWRDVNGDGDVDSGEPGIGGVTVDLWFDVNGNGVLDLGTDNYLRTTTTDANGEYLFKGLLPTDYLVDVTDTAGVLTGLVKTTGIANVDNNSQADPYAVTLTGANPSNLTADFGYEAAVPFNLSGTAFVDTNEDGTQNGGESGVSGVTVDLFLDLDGDGVLDPGEPRIGSTTTDGVGDYSFAGLPNGDYIVAVDTVGSAVEGFDQTTQTATGGVQPATIAGADSTDNDFGFVDDSPAVLNPAAIGDYVWLDVDGDGVQDIGEPGIPNVDLQLFDVGLDGAVGGGDDVLLDTVTTDAFGAYLFPGLDAGTYYVDVVDPTVPAGLTLSPGGADPTSAITVALGDVFLDADFGYRNDTADAVIGNYVWHDVDGDGVQDPGEPGIGGVTVDLVSAGLDGILGTGDDVVEGTATTTDDGWYLFTGVTPGDYVVDVTNTGAVLSGFSLTSGPQSQPDPSNPITVAAGDVFVDADFGYQNGTLFEIADRLWRDIDGDGVQDPGEPGIGGVTISLLDDDGDVIATTTTDANGDFSFDGLRNGDYTLSVTDNTSVLRQFVGTTPPATADALDVTIAGADVSGINFGYNVPGTFGDRVWSDADGDDVQDPGEPGIAGVTVQLWRDADGNGIFDDTVDTLIGSDVTDGAGNYLFEGLAQGTYFASVDGTQAALAAYTATTPDQEVGPNAAGQQIEGELANSAGSFLTADFGFQNSALPDLSGNVFEDQDRDGVDDGVVDPGIPGVTLDLVDASGTVVATTTTDADGDYAFLDLEAGDYTVVVTDTAGVLADYFLTSGLDAIDVTVIATDITDIDFGYAQDSGTGSIGDFVWLDANSDGIQGGAEDGIAGVTVRLFDAGPDGAVGGGDDVLVDTTVTGATGLYLFDGLDAGNYYAQVDTATLPAGGVGLAATTPNPSTLINLSEGEFYPDADFGFGSSPGVGAIGDFVWFDADADGIQDSGEVGIAGVEIQITGPGCSPCTTTTDADGSYLFTGLTPGNFSVVFNPATVPAAYTPVATNNDGDWDIEPLSAGQLVATADFGFPAAGTVGSIGDTVFLDADGDGVQDPGEGGIEGVTLNLLDSTGTNILATAVTDENGVYDFVGLPAGTYLVAVTDTGGVLGDLNLSAGTNPTAPIVLAAGQDYDLADFPYTPSSGAGTIGNLVWHDISNDGDVDPGEPGLQGVTVDLWVDVNGNGTIDAGVDNFLRTAVTDSNGEYEFNSLPAGTYLVDVTDTAGVLAGFTKTTGLVGVDSNSQADPYSVTLSTGAPNNLTADFGYYAAADLNISGTTFFDLDGDGSIDAVDDFGVDEVTVFLFRDLDGDGVLDPTDALIDSQPSTSGGTYLFTNLPPGDYIVAVNGTGTFVDGAIQTTQLLTSNVEPVTLLAVDSTDNDFGFNRPATWVLVTGLRSYGLGGHVVVEWETGAEIGSAGFYLYRLEADGSAVPVHDDLVPSVLGAPQGGVYRVLDRSAAGGETYVLAEVQRQGGERLYGPYAVGLEPAPTEARGLDARILASGWDAVPRPPSVADLSRLTAHRAAVQESEGRRAAGAEGRVLDARGFGQRAKILVDEDGLQYLSASRVAGALGVGLGKAQNLLQTGGLSLVRHDGRPVAWFTEGGDGLYFYGEGIDSLFTTRRVYWLEEGRGETMPTVSTGGGIGRALTFVEEAHIEEDVFAATFTARDPERDYWHWKGLIAGHPTVGTASFDLDLPGLDSSSGDIAFVTVHLQGASESDVPREHRAVLSVGSEILGATVFDGLDAHTARFGVKTSTLEAALLSTGKITVDVAAEVGSGSAQSLFYVDGFDVEYPRRYEAVGDVL
ncbi:MAG: SdrD B-like domain-containing protein, partial [Acidobacteriota bacterium]